MVPTLDRNMFEFSRSFSIIQIRILVNFTSFILFKVVDIELNSSYYYKLSLYLLCLCYTVV